MYSAILIMVLFTPTALGSYLALPVFVLLIPLLIFRLVNEEKILRHELYGYSDYCLRTRFRLVPLLFLRDLAPCELAEGSRNSWSLNT